MNTNKYNAISAAKIAVNKADSLDLTLALSDILLRKTSNYNVVRSELEILKIRLNRAIEAVEQAEKIISK